MPEKDTVRFEIVEVDGIIETVYASHEVVVGFGDDNAGSLAEALKLVAWLREQADELEQVVYDEFDG